MNISPSMTKCYLWRDGLSARGWWRSLSVHFAWAASWPHQWRPGGGGPLVAAGGRWWAEGCGQGIDWRPRDFSVTNSVFIGGTEILVGDT